MSTDMIPVTAAAPKVEIEANFQSKSAAKIAFFGIFGIQNLGNECTLQAIACNARNRLKKSQLIAISFSPEDTLHRHSLPALPMTFRDSSRIRSGRLARVFRVLFKRPPAELMDWAKAIKALRGTDLVVMTGTGMLTDYSTTAFGYPYHVFRWALAARMAGCKVRFVGIGVGPLYQRLSRWFVRWALGAADYRSFRDEFSRHRISSVFDSDKDYVFPDLAFSLPEGIFPAPRGRGGKQQIGLGIMDHRDVHQSTESGRDTAYSIYLDKMCEFVEWLVSRGYQVRILQGDAKHDVAPRAELKSRLERRGIQYEKSGIFDEGCSSVDELLAQIAQVDMVVSPRFHNLLLGLMMNIPGISISYDPKNDALLEGFGLGKYHQELFSLDVQLLIRHFKELQELSEGFKLKIQEKAHFNRALLEKQYDRIFSNI